MEALIAVLPIALIALACPLLMLFLMRGAHGGSGGGAHHASGDPAERLTQIEGELEHLRWELAQDRRTAPVAEEWLKLTGPRRGDPAERLTQIEGELEHLRWELAQDRRTAPVAEEWLALTVPGSDHETSPHGRSAEGANVGIFGRLFSKEGKVTDPVCAMSFPAQKAAATTAHGGTVYHFCSESCQSLFERDPEVFALKAARQGLQG